MIKKLGIIAGSGHLPLIAASNAYEQNTDLLVYSLPSISKIKKGLRPELRNGIRSIHIMDLDGMFEQLVQDHISDVLFLGKVEKKDIFKYDLLSNSTLQTLKSLLNMNDKTIFTRLLKEFRNRKINIISQRTFLNDLFLPEGIYSRKQPTKDEWEDIQYGMFYAKEISGLDIGQTIVVRNKVVIAVEAIESTNGCITRAGNLIKKKGGVVCKVERKKQDDRFDIPTIGVETLKVMEKSGCHILAFEEDKTLVATPAEVKKEADKLGITLVATRVSRQ